VSGIPSLAERIAGVRTTIERTCRAAGRDPAGVRLVAVAKTVSVGAVEAAYAEGLRDFGENRAPDLARKSTDARAPDASWHYLGKLQTGTIKHVARHARFVHAAEPGSALDALARRAEAGGRTVTALIEVDFTGRRIGVDPDRVGEAADRIDGLRGVRLRGLMTVAPITSDPEAARAYFRRLRELRDRVADDHPDARELSMGMSADYTIAIEEGATMVRVGTAIFGPRPGPKA